MPQHRSHNSSIVGMFSNDCIPCHEFESLFKNGSLIPIESKEREKLI